MQKWLIILLSILGGILLVAGIGIAILYMPNGVTPALLYVQSGQVEVDMGSGYQAAQNGMELEESAKVRTGADAQATVVLHESVFVTLASNTEVAIADLDKDHVQVTQSSGSVWSKVTKLGGVEQYSAQTPTTTATVRGTLFKTNVDGIFLLIVAEGTVNDATAQIDVPAKQKLVLRNGTYVVENLTAEDIAEIEAYLAHEIKMLQTVRLREVYKNEAAVSFAKRTYDATDADIENYLIDIDEGRRSEDQIRESAPAITPPMEKVFEFNAQIRKTKALLQAYS
jgi:hypothetical protein